MVKWLIYFVFQWFEERALQLETLDSQLKKLHASIETLVLHRRGTSIAMNYACIDACICLSVVSLVCGLLVLIVKLVIYGVHFSANKRSLCLSVCLSVSVFVYAALMLLFG